MSAAPARTARSGRLDALRAGGERWVPVLLVLTVAACAAIVMITGRDTTFWFDDWNFVLERRDWSLHNLLYAHNEHFSLVPVLIYKVLFETVGIADYAWYRLVLTGLDALIGVLVFLYCRPRIGSWASLPLVAAVMLMGAGYWDLLWAFQIGFLASIAAGLGALLALDRGDRRGEIVAAILLAVGLASSSIGVPIAAAVLVEVLWRDDRWKRLWIVGAPLVLYGAWYLKYGKSAAKASNAPDVPGWIAQAADDAAGAVTGLGADYGAVLVVALVAFLVRALLQERAPSPRLAALVALPLALWTATALARADMGVSPAESRYLFPGGLFLLLIAVELGRGHILRGRAAALFAVGFLAAAVIGANALEAGGNQLRELASATRASLTALELAGPRVPAEALPDPRQPQLRAFQYFEATRAYDSTNGYPLGELRRQPPATRGLADAALRRLLGVALVPAGPLPRGCARARTEQVVEVPSGGLVIGAGTDGPVDVKLRRFADDFPEDSQGTVAPGSVSTLRIPGDRAPEPWLAKLAAPGAFSACAAR